MLITDNNRINIESVREHLVAAKEILDLGWLAREHEKEPSDPVLAHRVPFRTQKQIAQMIREGKSGVMHPIAEAVLVGEEVVNNYSQTGIFVGSVSLYRLCALWDIARRKKAIVGIETRLPRLQGDQWKSALYELCTAAAYSEHAKITLIEEGISARPDIEVESTTSFYVECKAKLQYEDAIMKFKARMRREVLGAIQQHILQVNAGFIIRIDVKDDSSIAKLPNTVQAMIRNGIHQKNTLGAMISIQPFESGRRKLPEPMPALSSELWEWMFGFREWDEWHEVHTGGNFEFQNRSNLIVTAVERPVLICFRYSTKANRTQNIRQTLKDACRHQFKKHIPGVVHVLINTKLYGIGDRARPEKISKDLNNVACSIFKEYSRISAILFEIITPPRHGAFNVQYNKMVFQSENTAAKIISLPPISGVCIL